MTDDDVITDDDLQIPFGPIRCVNCGQAIREPNGGLWRDGWPWCGACVNEKD